MQIIKASKIQLVPNQKQQELINKTIGCKRFIYNFFLSSAKKDNYKGYNKYSKELTELKKDRVFLKEVDKFALQNALKDLNDGFQRFFKKQNRYPVFKKKQEAEQGYRTNYTNNNIEIKNNMIKLPKLKWVKLKKPIKINGLINNVTISKKGSKYYVSINYTTEIKNPKINKEKTPIIGADLGIKDYLITSEGNKYMNNKYLLKYENRLKKLQKRLSKATKYSKNYYKILNKLQKVHVKVANCRSDYLHKLSRKLINENQVIVLESLKVKNMLSNHKLAKHIQDASWGKFITMLQYKAEWYGSQIIQIDTFFPSSQLCSKCGFRNKAIKNLKIREWECPHCGAIHDRDINSAKNIKEEGKRLLKIA